MKKIILTFTLALLVMFLFSGCSDNIPNASSQTKSDSSKSTQATSQSSSTANNNTNSSTTSNDTSASSINSSSPSTDTKSSNDASSSTNSATSTDDINTTKSTSIATSTTVYKIAKKDLLSYSTMTKTTLIKTLGKNYKQQGAALTFSNGLSFYDLTTDTNKPTIIKCNGNVELMGIKNGMTFDKVQSILGKATVIKTYLGTKTNTVYKIQYTYGKDIVKVISPKNDGKDSFIEVCIQ